jgi:hypothetical protein
MTGFMVILDIDPPYLVTLKQPLDSLYMHPVSHRKRLR